MHSRMQESVWPPQRLVWPVSAGVVLLVAAIVGVSVWLDSTHDAGENTGAVPSVRSTPSPATADTPVVGTVAGGNSPWSALAEAEVVHLVYATGGNETNEVWIDRVSGDAIQKRTDATGAVVAVSQREGLTLTEYHLMFEQPSLTTRAVLEADDPTLLIATLQLEGYRYGLDTGGVTRVDGGRTEYDGQPVIEVHAWPGGELEHVALLDPATLFPLAMFTPGGEPMPLTYSLIVGLERDAVDRSVFAFDYAEPAQVTHHTLLAPVDLTAFAEYPVYTLGDAFKGYPLERVEQVQTSASDTNPAGDEVLVVYLLRGEDDIDSIQLRSRAALSEGERDGTLPGNIPAVGAPGEDVALSTGEVVRVVTLNANVDTPLYLIQLDRPGGFITIQIGNRDTGLRAAEALLRVNVEHFPVD